MPAIRRRCAVIRCRVIPPRRDYRISVKREDHGLVSQWLHDHIATGIGRRGRRPARRLLSHRRTDSPVVLLSAGIGVTPVLAMLHALSAARSGREHLVAAHHPQSRNPRFCSRSHGPDRLVAPCSQLVFYTQTRGAPGPVRRSRRLGLPPDAAAYLCGPTQFMTDMRDALTAAGLDPARYPQRIIRGPPADQPGHRRRRRRQRPHPPAGTPGTRTVDHLRPQRAHRQLVCRLRQSPGPGRGLRCANPLRVPKRGMSRVRDRSGCRGDHIRPVAVGAARQTQRCSSAQRLRESTWCWTLLATGPARPTPSAV